MEYRGCGSFFGSRRVDPLGAAGDTDGPPTFTPLVGRFHLDLGRLQDLKSWPGPREGWISHLRESPPQELGHVRGRCSYGAVSADIGLPPVVKWAQAGDWAAAARTWHVGEDGPLTTWP